MSTDGMTIRTRAYNCCAAPTCTSGGRQKTKGEHIGWRNYQEWKAQCKHADIPDDPKTRFRLWKNKEKDVFVEDSPPTASDSLFG